MELTSFTRREFIRNTGKAGMALATVWSTPALTAGSAPVSLPEKASPSGEAAKCSNKPGLCSRPRSRARFEVADFGLGELEKTGLEIITESCLTFHADGGEGRGEE